MPLGAFKTAMLGAAGSGSSDHFIGWWDKWASNGDYFFNNNSGIAVNSDGDMAVHATFVYTPGGNKYLPLIVYINNDTTIKWQKMLGTAGSRESTLSRSGIKFDNDGDVWAVSTGVYNQSGWTTDTGYSNQSPLILQQYSKTDGTLSNDRIFYKQTSGGEDNMGTICTIGTNGVWLAYRSSNAGGMQIQAMDPDDITSQYYANGLTSPNGGSQWFNRGGGYGDNWCAGGVVYRDVGGTTTYRSLICDNAGSAYGMTYQILYLSSNQAEALYPFGIDMDSSGDKYVAFQTGSLKPGIIAKISGQTAQSMTISWANYYEGTASTEWVVPNDLVIDSSGNNYTVGYVEATVDSFTGKHALIMKHNSSGTLQWTRMMTPVHSGTGKQSFIYNCDLTDDEESIVITGNLADDQNYSQLMVAKLPADGSGTGDYVTGTNAGTIKYYDGSSYVNTSSGHTLAVPSTSFTTGSSLSLAGGNTAITAGPPDSDLGTYRTESV